MIKYTVWINNYYDQNHYIIDRLSAQDLIHLSFYKDKFNTEELDFIRSLAVNLDESNLEILKSLEKKQHELHDNYHKL